MIPSLRTYILTLCDRGVSPPDISRELPGVRLGAIYEILREKRKKRPRAPRARTSGVPARVLELRAGRMRVGLIAKEVGVSRQYVHRIIAESAKLQARRA